MWTILCSLAVVVAERVAGVVAVHDEAGDLKSLHVLDAMAMAEPVLWQDWLADRMVEVADSQVGK